MEFPKLTFNHDDDSFINSIGLTETQFEIARYTILYEMISIIVLESDDNGSTKSSILERSMNRFKNDAELTFMTILGFDSVYNDTKTQLEFIEKLNKNLTDDSDTDTKGILQILKVKSHSLEDAMEQVKNVLKSERMMSAIKFLKDCKCDYNKFIDYTVHDKSRSELLGEDEEEEAPKKRKSRRKKDMSDIDEMIRKAFLNREEDEDE